MNQPNPYEQPSEVREPKRSVPGWAWLVIVCGVMFFFGLGLLSILLYSNVEQTKVIAPAQVNEARPVEGPGED